jgi:hypothetical protein
MIRKLLICPYFGDLPPWMPAYLANVRQALPSFEMLIDTDEAAFRQRVRDKLRIDCPPMSGTGKIHDYRAAFATLYADEIHGFDFWGHTDFDVIYGRVQHFMPDERLAEIDIHSDHWSYLCGPWTLYRNTPTLARVFMETPAWREELRDPRPSGWVETGYTELVNETGLRVLYEFNHGYQHPDTLETGEDGGLLERDREVSFFHFRHSKRYPDVKAAAAVPA